jgi:tryptophan-rich sensory protein
MKKRLWKKPLTLVGAVLLCQAAGVIGSLFTSPKIPGWYAGLKKPVFTPPSFVFAPVWVSLFLLMGASLYLIIEKKTGGSKRIAYIFFAAQLVLNSLWSALFFGAQSPQLAFFEILLLWVAILITAFSFSRISKAASILFIPYILWVAFAAILNFSIWRLNA